MDFPCLITTGWPSNHSPSLCCRSGMPFLRTYSVRVKKSLGLTSSSSSKQSMADATSPSCDLEEACRLSRSFSSSSVCSWGCQPMLRKKLWSSEYCLGYCWISSIYSDFPGFVGKSSRSSRKTQNLKYFDLSQTPYNSSILPCSWPTIKSQVAAPTPIGRYMHSPPDPSPWREVVHRSPTRNAWPPLRSAGWSAWSVHLKRQGRSDRPNTAIERRETILQNKQNGGMCCFFSKNKKWWRESILQEQKIVENDGKSKPNSRQPSEILGKPSGISSSFIYLFPSHYPRSVEVVSVSQSQRLFDLLGHVPRSHPPVVPGVSSQLWRDPTGCPCRGVGGTWKATGWIFPRFSHEFPGFSHEIGINTIIIPWLCHEIPTK